MTDFNVKLNLSGLRFNVVYSLYGSKSEAEKKAGDICVEQTIEFPADLVTEGDIRDHILGRIESFSPSGSNRWEAKISFAVETVGTELTQLMNVVFGNFSLKPGVRVERLELPNEFLKNFKGPRFGIDGLRKLLNVPKRPLFCTALKPMGLSPETLADLAYQFALGGVDMIKDDHGLADQPFAPFEQRIKLCAEAIKKANLKTGKNTLYFPNLSAPAHQILDKALFAKENGVGGLMVAPGLIGPDSMRMLADNDQLSLPILSHPAFYGTYIIHPENGLSHYLLFGQLQRLAGADAVIYPNYGGRFTFTREDCQSIVKGTTVKMAHFPSIFSMPGGGMTLARIPEMLNTYGQNLILLIGGALHKQGPSLPENCKAYMKAID